MTATYDRHFFDLIRKGAQRSAEIVVPHVLEVLRDEPIDSVVDVGGGEGWWAYELRRRTGCEAYCWDRYADASTSAPGVKLADKDLGRPLQDAVVPFSLAVCLEVVEHLPPERGPGLIGELCALAPLVLFSAAIPGQAGNGHVHCRWPSYWHGEFVKHGFALTDPLRWRVWNDRGVEPWYRQNLLLARKTSELQARAAMSPLSIVHPEIWDWRR